MHETRWHSLPHVVGRQKLLTVAGLAAVHLPLQHAVAADRKPRTALTVDEWPAIPVWPTWGGGRVIPMSFDPSLADPFLLLAHHKHSFSPGDPLRGPFKAVGGALGLPYVGDEGFAMHPHRGIDILTNVRPRRLRRLPPPRLARRRLRLPGRRGAVHALGPHRSMAKVPSLAGPCRQSLLQRPPADLRVVM